MKNLYKNIVYGMIMGLFLVGCDDSNQQQARQQEVTLKQASNELGMPAIKNFQEKRILKEILELRDKGLPTITYIVDMNGKLHKLCDSFGFGLPNSTQYTNPQYVTNGGHILNQADPNGLFSPSSSDGTWVICTNPNNKKATAVYIEPKIIVSPFALQDQNNN